MKEISKHKTKLAVIALVLVLAMAIFLVALPAVTAQEYQTRKTYAVIDVVPNPVGVGQQALINLGVLEYLQNPEDGWEDLTVTVERPDNKTRTLGPWRTDSTGMTGKPFVPDIAGTYYLQTHFPAQWYNYSYYAWWIGQWVTVSTFYEASESEKLALVVQEEPIDFYPGVTPPTEYWTRPIDPQLREWSTIAGSWLTTPENIFAPYNDGPESAHILWAKQLTTGGLVGGELGGHSFEMGDAYEGKWTGSTGPADWTSSAIILAGRLYYQHTTLYDPVVYHCVDLHTGEELWSKTFLDNRTIAFGQLFYWDHYNYHGTFAYLWVPVYTGFWWDPYIIWHAFDAFTGDWMYTMEGVPSGDNLYGPKGEIYRYSFNLGAGEMTLWNSSRVVTLGVTGQYAGSWGFNAHGETFNATRGIEWTKPIPTNLPGSVEKVFLEDRVIGGSISQTEVRLWGLNLKPGQEGQVLFNETWKAPAYWAEGNVTVSGMQAGWQRWSLEDKVGVLWVKETREHYGFSLETGKYLWGPTPSQHYLDAVEDNPGGTRAIAYGRLYCASVSGIVYCYNVTTGELLWTHEAYDPYNEILWTNNWWQVPVFITDGKIYMGHLEHSPIDPRPRGGPFICLNATTGDEIWRANGMFRQTRWGGTAIIGDSIIATMDTYDQRVYAIGRGPSATTVSIQNDVITHGGSVMIKGMVTDVSPGTKEYALTARFPNGVPAVAGEDMSEWMLYVYKQFPIPSDVTGVPVSLDTVDPNGNFIHIGDITTDGYSGTFGFMFTPEVPGAYTIMATFMGDESYGSSFAQTYLGVEEAPEPPPEYGSPEWPAYPEPEKPADYTPMFLGLIVAVAITICLVLYTLWAVRKQRG